MIMSPPSNVFLDLSLSLSVPLCHRRNKRAVHGKGNDKEKRRVEPNKENEKGGSCRHLTSSDQNSKADQVDMKFASNKSPSTPPPPPPTSLMPQFSLPLWLLSSFSAPHASIFFSLLPQPIQHLSISLKAMGSSLLNSVCFLHPSLPLCSYTTASFTHPLHPP